MKKIVVLSGAGVSAESGIRTFRDSNGLWEEYSVEQVASHEGWLKDPALVTEFYNKRREEYLGCQPNDGHRLIAKLEEDYDVTVITQNVDDLHEKAGSSNVIHLHGEIMRMCSSDNPEDSRYWQTLTAGNCRVEPGTKAGDGSLLRPYIVFFGEAVPMIEPAAACCSEADILVIIGTSLNVYPAAGLVNFIKPGTPVYIIDPNDVDTRNCPHATHIKKGGSEGMKQLTELLAAAK